MPESDPLLGRADRSAWRGYQVKGNLLAARPRYVRERWGDSGVADVSARLDAEARALFEKPVLPFAWYPFPTMATIDQAIIAGPMENDVSKMHEFGSTIARYDLSTLYKVLFKLGSPSFIMKRVGVVYSTYIRGGSIGVTFARDRHVAVTLNEGSLPFYFCSQGVSGWFKAAIELSGGENVEVEETACVHRDALRCRWEARWVE